MSPEVFASGLSDDVRTTRATGPLQVTGEVLATRKAGSYQVLSIACPGIAERVRPGHFVAVAVGGQTGTSESSMLLRRAFSIYNADASGAVGSTIEIVVSPHGPGTEWLVRRQRGDMLDVIAPLGTPFRLPKQSVSCVLIGGGYGAAPLFMLADQLQARGCRVDMILGAASEDKLFGVLESKRRASSLTITTDDGSAGLRGRVTDPLASIITEHGSAVVYSCGPMPMLRAVTEVASAHGAHSQTAVEEAMACGVGVCMTCVLPVIGDDGITRLVRSCTDGPVFFGDKVRWADVGTVPQDCEGSITAAGGGH